MGRRKEGVGGEPNNKSGWMQRAAMKEDRKWIDGWMMIEERRASERTRCRRRKKNNELWMNCRSLESAREWSVKCALTHLQL